ncbi:MAG TPA: hypothetical protein VHB77_15980 [Planctomycetaceae bacterium]|nr:hypothetical protein [Planctomycetaceae bacterium]
MLKTGFSIVVALGLTAVIGCGGQPTPAPAKNADKAAPAEKAHAEHSHGHEHEHGHAAHGPHEGELIELGNEEYHAELLHDDKQVTIYILDSTASKVVAIEAGEVTVNLKHDGKPEQFQLAASPDDSDPKGKSSRFTSENAELLGHLDEKDADAKLVVEINGKTYRGSLAHDHDHAH